MSLGCGHGHVYANPDGSKARCGGPLMCGACAIDLARYNQNQADLATLRAIAGADAEVEAKGRMGARAAI